jgi:hypothetical protein
MGFFSKYVYKNKAGEKFWLHMKVRGGAKLYYFSRSREGALWNVPRGYEVFETSGGFPMLRKKKRSFLSFLFSKIRKEEKV